MKIFCTTPRARCFLLTQLRYHANANLIHIISPANTKTDITSVKLLDISIYIVAYYYPLNPNQLILCTILIIVIT